MAIHLHGFWIDELASRQHDFWSSLVRMIDVLANSNLHLQALNGWRALRRRNVSDRGRKIGNRVRIDLNDCSGMQKMSAIHVQPLDLDWINPGREREIGRREHRESGADQNA